MSPSQVKHLFAHSSASNSRSLPHSPVTRAIDEVDGESSSFGVVSGASSPLSNTTDCEACDNGHRTPPPRSDWNLNTLLDRLRLHPNAHRDDTAFDFDDEAIGQVSPSASPVDEVATSQDDIVIAVMGPSGLGKTTFIDHAVGSPDAGCGSTPFTKEVRPVRYSHPGVRDIVLVDTPGCNDSMTDFQGKDYFKNVTFVTTMWDEVSEEVGWEREQDLRSDFWREMINLGSTTHRFEGTTESAWKIINFLSVSIHGRPSAAHFNRQLQEEPL